uniref:Uncharacterized protein n=1 Tax=Nelumbo nucifera TaxID=4432 RepID=A0A822XQ14_NELNU|nr:TPA_asm: hypothetical protein HUJ06_022734 [Nelumbo nucifera]
MLIRSPNPSRSSDGKELGNLWTTRC